ncbi:MAG: cytochrome c biogenesis protein ResB [Eubacteriales bacterium]
MLKLVKNVLVSRRLAIFLLVVLTGLLIIGSLLPKVAFLTDSERGALKAGNPLQYKMATLLTAPELSKTWFFVCLAAALFVATFSCVAYRVASRKKRNIVQPLPVRYDFSVVVETGDSDRLLDVLNGLRQIKNWHKEVNRNPAGFLFMARQKDWKFEGSVIFHASLLLVIIGGFITSLYGFNAGIVVTEGQSIPLLKENLVKVSRLPGGFVLPEFQVALNQIRPLINRKGEFVQYEAGVKIVTRQGAEEWQQVKINQPARYKGYQVSLESYGPAPWLQIINKETGGVIYDSFFNLRATPEGHDSIYMPNSNEHIMFRYFPDFYQDGRKIGTRSMIPKNPVFWVYTGNLKELLRVGEGVSLGKWLVKYNEFRQWAYFRVNRDPGEIWVYTGCVMAIFGLLLRFFRDERKIFMVVVREENGFIIRLKGTARYFPVMFEAWLEALWKDLNLKISEVIKHE